MFHFFAVLGIIAGLTFYLLYRVYRKVQKLFDTIGSPIKTAITRWYFRLGLCLFILFPPLLRLKFLMSFNSLVQGNTAEVLANKYFLDLKPQIFGMIVLLAYGSRYF